MRRSFVTAAVLLLILSVLPASTVRAAQNAPGAEWQEQRGKAQEGRAERVQERIDLIISRFDNNKERHIAAYNRVKDKLKGIADALEGRGYDLTQVRADYQALDQMILQAARDYSSFISKLEEARNYTPGDGQFGEALEEARALLAKFRQEVLGIRSFYQTVVRPHVQALKDQQPDQEI